MGNAFGTVSTLSAAAIDTPARPALRIRLPIPEISLAAVFVLISLVISLSCGLPISLPTSASLAFTGMSSLVPAIVIVCGFALIVLTQPAGRAAYFCTALLSYGAIVIIHFNIKLWAPMINPTLWDAQYRAVDDTLRPMIDGALAFHNGLASFVPVDRLYLFAFLAMFGCSMIVHSCQSFGVFRKVVLASMLVHVVGGLSYLIAPALGPFIEEGGVNAVEQSRQAYMFAAHQASVAGGASWLSSQGSTYLATGLAAMPSLHVASSAVFVYFAWRYERRLSWFYWPLFAFIMIEAVATRWHYLVDIAAGLALTAFCVVAVEWCFSHFGRDAKGAISPSGSPR
jgi:PAP2 superfamily